MTEQIQYYRTNFDHPQTEDSQNILGGLVAKKERLNGLLVGFHATTLSTGQDIHMRGFSDEWVATFHDVAFIDQAREEGRKKALAEGEKGYAIIRASSDSPRIDLAGRPLWFAEPDRVRILSVEFYDLKDNPLSEPERKIMSRRRTALLAYRHG